MELVRAKLNQKIPEKDINITIKTKISSLWKKIQHFSWTGEQPTSAYDTAYVAMITNDQGKSIYPESISWLLTNQFKDGSWGAKNSDYICDKMLSTLASLSALTKIGHDKEFIRNSIQCGINFVNHNIDHVDETDPNFLKSVGFELLFPTLLSKISQKNEFSFSIESFIDMQYKKLDKLPIETIIKSQTPIVYSMEFLEALSLQDPKKEYQLDHLLSQNGSLGANASSTSWYASKKPKSLSLLLPYLNSTRQSDGGWPAFADSQLFTVPYSLYILDKVLGYIPSNLEYLLDLVSNKWSNFMIGFSEFFPIPDADDTSLGIKLLTDNKILSKHKEELSWSALGRFYNGEYFITFPYENKSEPSYLVNIHVLETIKNNNKMQDETDNVLTFLSKHLSEKKAFQRDKYHDSAYLQNARGILAFDGIADDLANFCLRFFLDNQDNDGLWGTYGPNYEETSHSVLALSYYHLNIEKIDLNILERAIEYLLGFNINEPENFLPIWIAKNLFSPYQVQYSNLLASLIMYLKAKRVDIRI